MGSESCCSLSVMYIGTAVLSPPSTLKMSGHAYLIAGTSWSHMTVVVAPVILKLVARSIADLSCQKIHKHQLSSLLICSHNNTVKILVCNFELQCPSMIALCAAETLLLCASTKLQ